MKMMLVRLLPCAGALALTACSTSSTDAVKPLPANVAAQSYVSDIKIRSVPSNVSSGFEAMLRSALAIHLHECAHGTRPLRLEVTVAYFKPQDPAKTIIAGDANKIKGTAQLIDPGSGVVLGDYDIDRSTGWGGIIAAIAMSDAEGKMTSAFADEICHLGFGSTD